jgi:hypothetical protein
MLHCEAGESPDETRESPDDWVEQWQQMGKLGRGFLVWESNRTGRWRIWYRKLDGSGLRQLSPDEEGRDHFAPHIAPDGTHLVYLSYPAPWNAYQSIPKGVSVPLHLLRIGDGSDRVLVPSARSYREDRAVVWIGNHELIYPTPRGAGPSPSLSMIPSSAESRCAGARTAASPTSPTTVAGDSGSRTTAVRCAGSIWSPGRRGT